MKRLTLFFLSFVFCLLTAQAQQLSKFCHTALTERGTLYFVKPSVMTATSKHHNFRSKLHYDYTYVIAADTVRMLFTIGTHTPFKADSAVFVTSDGARYTMPLTTAYKQAVNSRQWDNRLEVLLPTILWRKFHTSEMPYTLSFNALGGTATYGWATNSWKKLLRQYQLLFDEIDLNLPK